MVQKFTGGGHQTLHVALAEGLGQGRTPAHAGGSCGHGVVGSHQPLYLTLVQDRQRTRHSRFALSKLYMSC